MKVFEKATALRRALGGAGPAGFVPTMGYFHEGHLALMRAAAADNETVVVSVFVNPLQFGPDEDLETYPHDLERDTRTAEEAGVTHLFVPSVEEMYPGGSTATQVQVGELGEVYEGKYRPGHFAGVATVCVKLFNIVQPQRVYFGQKDAQQLAVIRRVVNDLNYPAEVVACPTVRDKTGLALSSRNSRLSPEQAKAATILSRALFEAQDQTRRGETDAGALCGRVLTRIREEPAVKVQYADLVDPLTFTPLEKVEREALLVLAAFAGDIRLIDNILLEVRQESG